MNKQNLGDRSKTDLLHRPILLRPSSQQDKARYMELMQSSTPPFVTDTYESQLEELFKSRTIGRVLSATELSTLKEEYCNGLPMAESGVWFFYPWINHLVHLLDKGEFVELRTNRNRNKITQEEQGLLASKSIGIVGLSVGRSVAMTIAQERIAGEIRLADFDAIDLSNLNRIRTGVDTLGVNKAVAAAREIALVDPYLQVRIFTKGLLDENMEDFFLKNGKLDLLVEECDTVQVKISSRLKAKELGIPVVMDTSDRGMIDVERFDLEPDRPILHGWIKDLDLSAVRPDMTNEEKAPFLAPMVGIENMSPRMKASVLEMGHSTYTWPQLASSVSLGGAVATDVSRRILLGSFTDSGRWYVDLHELINAEQQQSTTFNSEHVRSRTRFDQITDLQDHAKHSFLSDHALRELIEAAGQAPSAGNLQPWRFSITGQTIHVLHDLKISCSVFDADHMIADLGLGACIENILTKAKALGVSMQYELFPSDSRLVIASIFPTKTIDKDENAARMINIRLTDRSIRHRRKISSDERIQLLDVALEAGCRLKYFGDDVRLAALASITGEAERLRMLNPIAHNELFEHELNWGNDGRPLSEGLDIQTLGLKEGQKIGMQIARDPRTMALLKKWDQGSLFRKSSAATIQNSCGLLLVSTKGRSRESRLRAGMSLEKAWLHANDLGFAIHPVSAAIFLSQHGETAAGIGLTEKETEQLQEISAHLNRIFELGRNEFPQFLMRVSDGGKPTKRSAKRAYEDSVVQLNTRPATNVDR